MDMFIKDDQTAGIKATKEICARYPALPKPVRRFIKFIKDNPNLRWGGDFTDRDPVHSDDHWNGDSARWDHRYLAMQRAVQLGGGGV